MWILLGIIASAIIFTLLGTYTSKEQRSKIIIYLTTFMLIISAIFVYYAVQTNFEMVYDYVPYVTQFAFGFFITVMFAKPVHLIFKSKATLHLLQARREAGITVWLLFVPHAMLNATNFIVEQGNFDPPILGGVTVVILMTIIVFTSFNWTKKFVSNKWYKIIQNIAYFAFFLALMHGFLMTANFLYLGIAATYLIIRVFVYLRYENKKRKWLYASILSVLAILTMSSVVATSMNNKNMVPEPYFKYTETESTNTDSNDNKNNNSDDMQNNNDSNNYYDYGGSSDDSTNDGYNSGY